jgi:hypothetical protein
MIWSVTPHASVCTCYFRIGSDSVLCAASTPHCCPAEMYLLREGGVSGHTNFGTGAWMNEQPIGPLSVRQVRHLQLLARLHGQKRR